MIRIEIMRKKKEKYQSSLQTQKQTYIHTTYIIRYTFIYIIFYRHSWRSLSQLRENLISESLND